MGNKGRRPTCFDLFCGAGGFAEGFRQAGFDILVGTDLDPAAGATFMENFPDAAFFECSVSELTGKELLKEAGLARGELDCLIGGPPCQSFSYNNHERSRRKSRARLFRDYLRIVEAVEPKCLVMENVPGILTVGGGAIVEEIYRELGKLGYECEARILYSEDFGVPQQRRRVFFVATSLGWSNALFPIGEYGPAPKPQPKVNRYIHHWAATSKLPPPPNVWSAIGDLPTLKNGEGTQEMTYGRAPQTSYQRAMRGDESVLRNHIVANLSEAMLQRIAHVPAGGNWRDIPFDLLPAGMQRAKPTDHTKRYGRLAKGGLCCTVLTKCDPHWGSYIHPIADRTISVREAARLQSFPDSFAFPGHRTDQFQQIGNAVPPLLAKAVGSALLEHLNTPMSEPSQLAA